MPGRSIAGTSFRIQRETVPGTAVTTAMRRYLALRGRPGWDGAAEPFAGGSGKMATTVLLTDESGVVEIEGAQCFNALPAIGASRIALPTTIATAEPTAFDHTMEIDPNAEDTVASYTYQWGDATQTVQGVYGRFNTLGLDVQRGTLGLSTSMISRAPETGATAAAANEVQTVTITGTPTGGTFTLSFRGFTTAGIAFDALASAVELAFEALSSVGAGNGTVGGGPGPGTPWTITFTGDLAGRNVELVTADDSGLTGGTSPAVAVTETTPGNPTDIAAVPIPPRGYDVYADDAWEDLGTTKLLANYQANVNLGDKFVPDAVINSALTSFESMLEAENQEHAFALRLGFDAQAIALMATFTAGATKFLRWQVTGPLIGTGVSYLMQFDAAVKLLSRGSFGPAPNSPAVTVGDFAAIAVPDATTGKAIRLRVINTVASY